MGNRVSPKARLESIVEQAQKLLQLQETHEHAFNLMVDQDALDAADNALDSMVFAIEDEIN